MRFGFVRVLGVSAGLLFLAGCGGGNEAKSGAPSRPLVFIGFDANPQLIAALKSGDLQGVVLQHPLLMGETGVKTLVRHLKGEADPEPAPPAEATKAEAKAAESSKTAAGPRTISTGEILATPENMETPEVAERLNPPKADHSVGVTAAAKPGGKVWRIMVIPKGTSHEFWKSIHAGALKAAEELGNVEILWQGPTVQDDIDQQRQIIENAVASKVDGIVLAPADSRALVKPVEGAIAKGIPVVIIDSALESDKIVAFVATDNHRGGELAAKRLAELLGERGKIILLRYPPGSAATQDRERGFMETISRYPNITYLSKDQDSGPDAESARAASQNLLSRHRGEVEAIFCPNESSTQGMLGALREAGMLKKGSR